MLYLFDCNRQKCQILTQLIVEFQCDASALLFLCLDQMPAQFEQFFLSLFNLLLRSLALGDLLFQLCVGHLELRGAIPHSLLKPLIQSLDFFFRLLALGDVMDG